MSTSLVSVIMPAYNAEKFIGKAIQSVLNQTYPHWEMLVVDDGSTDGTRACIEPYLSDSRIIYCHQKNQERAVARNNGIRRASGKYIAFLDADDVWLPDKLQHQVASLEAHPEAGLCFTNCRYVDNEGALVYKPKINLSFHKNPFCFLLKNSFIANSTVIVPRTVFDKVGLFDETLPAFGSEDWDMWLRITLHYPIQYINLRLMLYRVHENNTSPDKMHRCQEAVLQKLFVDLPLSDEVIKNRDMAYGYFYLRQSQAYLNLDQKKMALKYWWHVVRKYPQALFTTRQGVWVTLKLFSLYPLISKLKAIENLNQKLKGSPWLQRN